MRVDLDSALESGPAAVEALLPKLQPGLALFIRTRFGAPEADAEDAASGAILAVLEQLRAGHVFDAGRITAYLRVAARRLYYRTYNRGLRHSFKEEFTEDDFSDALVSDHLEILVEEERRSALARCIETLAADARAFLEHMLANAAESAEDVARKFGLTANHVGVKKYRLIKQMHDCVKKKLG